MKRNWFLSFWPAIVWLIFIFIICLTNGNNFPKNDWLHGMHIDKIAHGIIYFILFILFAKGSLHYANRLEVPARIVEGYLLICGIVGAVIEYLQSNFSSNRSFDVWDMAANVVGAIIASFLYERICNWKIFNLIWR
jgi:VanZ family protein